MPKIDPADLDTIADKIKRTMILREGAGRGKMGIRDIPLSEVENGRVRVGDLVTSDPNLDAADVALVFHARRARVHLATASDMKRILLSFYSWEEETSREVSEHALDRSLIAGGALRTSGPAVVPVDPEVRSSTTSSWRPPARGPRTSTSTATKTPWWYASGWGGSCARSKGCT